jgi:hypothetical protein
MGYLIRNSNYQTLGYWKFKSQLVVQLKLVRIYTPYKEIPVEIYMFVL